MTSHPETTPSQAHLLGDIILAALDLTRKVWPGRKFKLLQAVDGFALDMLPLPMRGFYQGLMSRAHLTMDRIPGRKSPLVGRLLASHYSRAFFRILKALKKGRVVCLALSGGVIHNSRLIFAVREFARRIFSEVPREKRAGIHRRDFELAVIGKFAKDVQSAAVTGKLSPAEESELAGFLLDKGLPESGMREKIDELKDELKLLCPYRKRFFRALFARLSKDGKPLLILPVSHLSGTGETGVFMKTPWLVSNYDGNWEEELVRFVERSFGS